MLEKLPEIKSMGEKIQNNMQCMGKIGPQDLKALENIQSRLKEEVFDIEDLNKLHQIFSQLCEGEFEDDFRRGYIPPLKDHQTLIMLKLRRKL